MFVFFAVRPNAIWIFCEIDGRVGNEMPGKSFGYEKVVPIGQKRRGSTSLFKLPQLHSEQTPSMLHGNYLCDVRWHVCFTQLHSE